MKKNPMECENIEDIRIEIDSIDNEIVKLIATRSEYVKRASAFKKNESAVRDEDRVKKVIESKKQLAIKYQVDEYLIEEVYKTMINNFIKLEMKEWSQRHL